MGQALSPTAATDADIDRLVDAIDEQMQHAGLSSEPVKQLRELLKRRQEAESLLRQEGRLVVALEAMSDGFAALDTHWRYIYVNTAATRLLGKGREELLGRTPWEVCPQADTAMLLSNFERSIEENRPVEFEVVCHTLNVTLQCRCRPSPEGIVIFFDDVTERKRTEQELRESEERFRLLVEGVQGYALFLLDPQGHIISWNSGAERIKGYRGEEILGRHFSICYAPEDVAKRMPQHDMEVAAEQGRYEWTGWVVRKDGSRFWAEVLLTALRNPDGTLRGFAELARDITQRMQAEEALRQSEDWLRLALDAADLGTWDYYPPSGRLLWSDRCKAMFGLAPDVTMTYDLFLQHVHPDDRDYAHRGIQDSCDPAGPGTQDMEYRALWPDGTVRWIKVLGRAFCAGSGSDRHAARIVGTAQDITQRRAIEGQLHAAREAAEAANRSKDQFIAVLSHELRTPLTPVLTELQMMERDQKVPAAQRQIAQMMHRNLAMETRLIDDLLDVTRLTRGKLELHTAPVDLHSLLQHAVGLCDSDLRSKRLQCIVQLDATAHYVQGDASRLEQVFWNLLKNAVKFTPSGGRIIVHSQQVGADDIEVSIQDSGVGIEPGLLPHIFDAFEQGGKERTRQFGGLGLGLAISKGVVDLHGGTLSAASDGKGRGATFTVRLPALAQMPTAEAGVKTTRADARARVRAGQAGAKAAEGAERSVGAAGAGDARAKRLLLVEDHPDTGKVMAKVLRNQGYDVRRADSVATALRAAEAEEFDLLICDIGLPDGSGLDLMRQLSWRRPVKAIALSGYGMEEDVRKSKQAGFLEHLTKPVDLQQLQEVLDRVLA